jgi:glycosyltransferase involved in cell wall biosynthesis
MTLLEPKIIAYSNIDLQNYSTSDFVFSPHVDRPKSALGILKYIYTTVTQLKTIQANRIIFFNPLLIDSLCNFFYKITGGKAISFFYDLNLKLPKTAKDRILNRIKKFLLSYVDIIICMHKDTSAYKEHFGLSRIIYVPFKANNFSTYELIKTSDQDYALACGVSHRDYKTFFDAIKDLPIKVKIVLPDDRSIVLHKAYLGSDPIPSNVEIIRHDFNKNSWNNILAAAKFVVIPITADCIQPAGISVYLEAMLLKKAVVISDCPSSRKLIDQGQAVIVERANSQSLKNAIMDLYGNSEKRNTIAEAGFQYAKNLGGVDRLINDIKSVMR